MDIDRLHMRLRDIGEIGLIERISRGIRLDASVIKGIGDDAAVIAWKRGKYLLYACDMLVEDVHFTRSKATPFQIGWKAMARNLSDIAAMGGVGRYAVVSIGADPGERVSFIGGIYKGIKAVCDRFKVNIVGGDMSKSKKTVIDISIIGEVEKNKLVTRSGARQGDMILVTGSLGGSMKHKHLNFTPRIDEARLLVNNFRVSSMIDVTDGLILDLSRILTSSRAGARIYQDLIPVSKDTASFEQAVTDGEDFELLFTMSPKESARLFNSPSRNSPPVRVGMDSDRNFASAKFTLRRSEEKDSTGVSPWSFKALSALAKTPVAIIGEITAKPDGFTLITHDAKEKKINPKGYLHF